MLKKICFLLFFSVSAVFASKPVAGFYFSQGLAGSLNALGVSLDTALLYRIPLSDSSDILWQSMKIDIGVKNSVTPADERVFVYMNIEPIAIFDISLAAGFIDYYKLFGFGFDEVTNRSPLSDSVISKITQQDKPGFFFKVSPEFKVQAGPVILVDALDYIYINVGADDKYYNDRREAIVMKFADNCFVNNVYALYDFSNGWYAGLNYYIIWNPSSMLGTQYIAGLGSYEWKMNPSSSLSFTGLLGWYLNDGFAQYNTGMPYIAVVATYNLKL